INAIAREVDDGDDTRFHQVWTKAADRLAEEAHAALKLGRRTSARELLLRAACFYGASYHTIFGDPVDPRLATSFRWQYHSFHLAMELSDDPVMHVRIPLDGASMPAYVIPAEGRATEVRPLLI